MNGYLGVVTMFTLLLIPWLFQIILGFNKKVKCRQVIVVSVVLWFCCGLLNVELTSWKVSSIGSHDGLPTIGIGIMELFVGVIMIVTLIIQFFAIWRRR
jgi:hypothetical protein